MFKFPAMWKSSQLTWHWCMATQGCGMRGWCSDKSSPCSYLFLPPSFYSVIIVLFLSPSLLILISSSCFWNQRFILHLWPGFCRWCLISPPCLVIFCVPPRVRLAPSPVYSTTQPLSSASSSSVSCTHYLVLNFFMFSTSNLNLSVFTFICEQYLRTTCMHILMEVYSKTKRHMAKKLFLGLSKARIINSF